jgi:LPXTG-site transpeptidase (sortase) family protein
MAMKKLKTKFACPEAGFYLGGIALLIMSFHLNAETAQTDEGGWVSYQQPVQTALWIQDPYSGDNVLAHVGEPDKVLWNATRITDYEDSLKVDMAPALGILTIEKLDIQIPIFNGTEDLPLNRGVGRIKGMAKMDEVGNLGIAGHRDGIFRGLKDIQMGDDIEIQTTRGVENYAVSSITIVPKDDISILSPTEDKTLTLVTCYPFYFVGHAPKRYIVKATAKP